MRLAVATVGAIVVMGIGPATAGIGADDRNDSWCDERADVSTRVMAPGHVEFVLGAGTTTDRPVQSAFACVDAGVADRWEADGLVTAWLDAEYGRAGWSCVRQPVPSAVTCKRTSVPLPGRATGRADSPQNEWWIGALGVGVSYDVASPTTRAGTRTPAACVRNVCRDEGEYRAWARTGDAEEPQPPDPTCTEAEACAASQERRSDPDDGPTAGVQDTSVTAPVGPPPAG